MSLQSNKHFIHSNVCEVRFELTVSRKLETPKKIEEEILKTLSICAHSFFWMPERSHPCCVCVCAVYLCCAVHWENNHSSDYLFLGSILSIQCLWYPIFFLESHIKNSQKKLWNVFPVLSVLRNISEKYICIWSPGPTSPSILDCSWLCDQKGRHTQFLCSVFSVYAVNWAPTAQNNTQLLLHFLLLSPTIKVEFFLLFFSVEEIIYSFISGGEGGGVDTNSSSRINGGFEAKRMTIKNGWQFDWPF